MNRSLWFFLAAGAIVALAGCPKKPPAGNNSNGAVTGSASAFPSNPPPPQQFYLNHAQPRLKTMKIWVGTQEVDAELAVNITEVATGMMYRTNMTDAEGMLFLFGLPGQRSFYMRNCVVPLSAAYIDDNGVVDQIVDLNPGVEEPVPSTSDRIKYVLEVPQGWFKRMNVATGSVVATPTGPLKQFSGILQ